MTTDAAQQQQAQPKPGGEGDQKTQDGQPAGGGADQQQQAGAGQQPQAGADQQQQAKAGAAATDQAKPDGTAPDPYKLLAELLETEAGQNVVVAAGGMLSEGQAAAAAPAADGTQVTAPAQAAKSPQRAELEATIAAGGDGVLQAKADLLDLVTAEEKEREGRSAIEQGGVAKGKAAALADIFKQPQFQALNQAQRTEIGVKFQAEGPGAALTRALEMVQGDGQQNQGTAEQQAQRAKENEQLAADQQQQKVPVLAGAQSPGGVPEIRQGQSSESALNDYFAYQDSQN
jgi:hypothetical protein